MNRKSGFLLFLCSCIPGCGQMYQGYMKRGVSLLGMCCAIIAISSFLGIGELAILLPVIWIYSFFDSYNLRSFPEDAPMPDEYLFGLSDLDNQRLSALCQKRHSIIGWILVGVGVYVFYNTVIGRLMNMLVNYYEGFFWLHSLIMYTLPRAVVTILIICLGVWFIRGPKPKEEESEYTFVPPEAPPEVETVFAQEQPQSESGEEAHTDE